MKIGVVHPNLNLKGGAEYVTIEIIQSLSRDHEVELITFEQPDTEDLDSFYDTDLEEKDFSARIPVSGLIFRRFRGFGFKVRNHMIKRHAKAWREDYDLLISGMDEADFGEPGFQYVHFPESVNEQTFHETGEITTDLTRTEGGLLYKIYLNLVERFFREGKSGVEMNETVCNSNFTKEVYEEVFDNTADIVNPPVSLEVEDSSSFDSRENGFICIGNINPAKGQKEIIQVIEELREHHDVHLHIIGGLNDSGYCQGVQEMAEGREYVQIERKVDREELKQMINGHRYGIHNFEGEHYGLAPAEMVKGGCIPFVPDRGGPRDIIGNREELIFSSFEEAVSSIGKVLDNEELQQDLFEHVKNINLNSPEEFRAKIREKIEGGAEK